jgi:DNA-binding Lrp family transcriptional regulator
MVRAYVLIQTEAGQAGRVAKEVAAVDGVGSAVAVTGPYDVIARVEAPSIDDLGRMVVGNPGRERDHPHPDLSRRALLSGRLAPPS